METAYDVIADQIVEAAQLQLLEIVDKERYVCRGCGAKVFPASYRPENQLRPHFRIQQDGHLEGCDVDGEQALIKRGRVERLSTPSGAFPALYPSGLSLIEQRPRVGDLHSPPRAVGSSRVQRQEHVPGNAPGKSRWLANSIRPICRTYINFPFNRDLPLSIPGIDRKTYGQVFRYLSPEGFGNYTSPRVYYAPIRWSRPVETPEWLEVTLDAGDRDERWNLLRGYRVRVEWENWSEARRRYVRNEIEFSRKEAIEANKADRTIKGYLFFIPKAKEQSEEARDLQDELLFRVTDHRLICCIVDSIAHHSNGAPTKARIRTQLDIPAQSGDPAQPDRPAQPAALARSANPEVTDAACVADIPHDVRWLPEEPSREQEGGAWIKTLANEALRLRRSAFQVLADVLATLQGTRKK